MSVGGSLMYSATLYMASMTSLSELLPGPLSMGASSSDAVVSMVVVVLCWALIVSTAAFICSSGMFLMALLAVSRSSGVMFLSCSWAFLDCSRSSSGDIVSITFCALATIDGLSLIICMVFFIMSGSMFMALRALFWMGFMFSISSIILSMSSGLRFFIWSMAAALMLLAYSFGSNLFCRYEVDVAKECSVRTRDTKASPRPSPARRVTQANSFDMVVVFVFVWFEKIER
mmetsp:Transcript_25354/g.55684  ORF Transcript_25354/g.55684 Transcript_25354/m.55684 type:complete len:230 (+) Transcript_25354:664-1353(+)